TVQAIDAQNCPSHIAQTKITVLPPLLAAGMQTTVCDGLPATIYPTITSPGNGGLYTYLWSNTMTNPSITVTANYQLGSQNIYTVIISDGCTMPDAIAQITVNVNPNPVISFSAMPQKGCVPLTVQYHGFSNGSNDNFQWTFGNGQSSNNPQAITTYTQSGFYTPTLVVTNSNGCTTSSVATNYIEVFPKPSADFTASSWSVNILEPQVTFFNQSIGATSYTWNFGDYANPLYNISYLTNPSHEYLYAGTYTVILIAMNNQGCYDNIAKVLYVEPEFHIYIPNVFTPDGNGLNDIFQPKGIGIDESNYKMLIFDRWGEKIFESNDFKKGWDGSVKGNPGKVTQDVYVYKIYVRDMKGNKHEFVGHVTCLPGQE
ncbi:MAG: PKD domain-containing protein, partial [Bacteroidia bacterium]|nr:PKD domain-containing protein [Bacteroidia bacterium]